MKCSFLEDTFSSGPFRGDIQNEMESSAAVCARISVCVCVCRVSICAWLGKRKSEEWSRWERKGWGARDRERVKQIRAAEKGGGVTLPICQFFSANSSAIYSVRMVFKHHMIKPSGCRSGLMSALHRTSAQWHPNKCTEMLQKVWRNS